jgi:hypothetical protein
VVSNIGFLGHYSRCGVSVGNATFHAHINSRRDVSVGSQVALRLPYQEALALADVEQAAVVPAKQAGARA